MSDQPAPTLFILGASHHRTPIELREKLALTADKMELFQAQLKQLPGLREHAVVNTCNRVEFYGFAENSETVAKLQAAFCSFQGFSEAEFAAIRHQAQDIQALEHLIEVSSGLDSQMLGETEILGQVKDAYASAQTRHTVGPVLNRVFQKTFQYAKYIRSHTAITEGQISVANVAVDLATKIFGQLSEARILLLGAGEIGDKTAKAFQSRGANALTVASRRLERAMELAGTLGAAALPFDQWSARLHDFDIVVCSTAAPDIVVTKEIIRAAMKQRPARPLFFIDLALPRDVDPNAAEEENVFLYNLDDLAKIAEENLAARTAEVKRAREILAEKANALWQQLVSGPLNGRKP
ncbi:MAG: glutamyl-tRNA reductase [Nibricoccus sp.]